MYYTWTKLKKSYKNNKFKISGPTWNEKINLLDGLYSVLDIQDYFEYFIKKNEELTDNPPIKIYANKIENRITFKIKRVYYLALLIPETMELLGRNC